MRRQEEFLHGKGGDKLEQASQGNGEPPTLEPFKRYVDVALKRCGTWFSGGLDRVMWWLSLIIL